MKSKPCPKCGGPMWMMYGCHWDYDRWVCAVRGCGHEEELETTTDLPEKEGNEE